MHFERRLLQRLHRDVLLVVPNFDSEHAVDGHREHALSEEASRDARARNERELGRQVLQLLPKRDGVVHLPQVEEALVTYGQDRRPVIRRVVDLPNARRVPGVQDADGSLQLGRNDSKLAVVAGRYDGEERVVNLLDVLDIIPVVHMLERFDQVSELSLLAHLFLAVLIVLVDKRPLNLVLPAVVHAALVPSVPFPEYLAV